jgi:hypothetical protein
MSIDTLCVGSASTVIKVALILSAMHKRLDWVGRFLHNLYGVQYEDFSTG